MHHLMLAWLADPQHIQRTANPVTSYVQHSPTCGPPPAPATARRQERTTAITAPARRISYRDRVSLGQRAAIANNAGAALALSIHDQAGRNGGIGFDQGNNTVYYQSVGDYRETPRGTKVFFTDRRVAALSRKYGQIFRTQRASAQGEQVALQGDVGYDLGARGLPAGNIWLVQLLSRVPWIYNEAGGNSAGMSGLNAADEHIYAEGLVAGVEHCLPLPR